MKTFIALIFSATLVTTIHAQQITGGVYGADADGSRTVLPAASVYWAGSGQGVTTGVDGRFAINQPHNGTRQLVASFTGFANDTLVVPGNAASVEFVLIEGMMLDGAVIAARQKGNYISRITPIQTELITSAGLQKLACCNLAESFENSASVTVGFTDAVSGAKQIQMLGLSGVYTQMLDENIPTLRGLASAFGWNYVPGPWLESIQVSKGTSSVINGYESTTGQINMEFKKPDLAERLFVNLFGAGDGRMEANIATAIPVNAKFATGLMLHGSNEQIEHDSNRDGFMDMPRTRQFNIYNRWLYKNPEKRLESRLGVKYLHDDRNGGQIAALAQYRTHIENRNFNIFNKTGFGFGRHDDQSIGVITSYTHHEINSVYGFKTYGGTQDSFYGNILLSSHFTNANHKYTVGVSFMYDRFDEYFSDHHPVAGMQTPEYFDRTEAVPGAFAQYTYNNGGKLTFIAGLRGDYHSRFGALLTPRTNVKYDFTENIIFRLSAGRGYRSPNIISENIGLLASSRTFRIDGIPTLGMERAWNYGANLTFYIPMTGSRTTTVSMDYYHTSFSNQAIMDMEYSRREVYFYNLNGKSFANAWQMEINTTFFDGFDLYAAYRRNDTRITYTHGNQRITAEKPLVNKYRGLINLSYATKFEKWKIDLTAQFNGSSRLPNLSPGGYMSDAEERAPAYRIYFVQITRKTKRIDFYAGCENIFNFRQEHPIINADDPFSPDFDASRIWGPLMGRKLYAGIRLRIET